MMDLVTVFFGGDLGLMRLQARSVARFLDPAVIGRIHLINNDDQHLHPAAAKQILPEYGPLAGRVVLHHWQELMSGRFGGSGWRTQQALKLLIASRIDTDLYLVLDAKNHFIRPVAETDLVVSGKPVTSVVRPTGNLAGCYRDTMLYLGLDPETMLQRPMPATTPFILYTDLVRELIGSIETREGKPFDAAFLERRELTEFYLYAGYITQSGRDPEVLYRFGPRMAVMLFTRWPEREEDVLKALANLRSPQYKLFGLHRKRIPQLSPDQREIIIDYWREIGLVTDRAEAEALLAP